MAITNEQLALRHLKFYVETHHEYSSKFCMTHLTSKVLMVVTEDYYHMGCGAISKGNMCQNSKIRVSYYYKQLFSNISLFFIL
jgi:hypothetical protein